jgi:hypothetical protein
MNSQFPELNRPRIEENDQYVESQKDEGVEIVTEIELHPGLADGFHTTFKDGRLDGVGVTGDDFQESEDNGGNDHYKGEKNDNNKKQSD